MPQNGFAAIKSAEGASRFDVRAKITERGICTMEPLLDFPRKLGVWCDDWLLVGYRLDGEQWVWLDSKNGAKPRASHGKRENMK